MKLKRVLARLTFGAGLLSLPTGRGWAAVFASASLLGVAPSVGFPALATVVVVIAIDALAGRREAPVEARLALPRRTGQGQATTFSIELYEPGTRARRLTVALDADPELCAPTAFAVRELRTRPRRSERIDLELWALARGRRRIEALDIRVAGPLRLAWTRRRLELDGEILVVPGLREVLAHQSRAAFHLRRGLGRRRTKQRGDGGAFESLREYARGDDPRHLDWKATARRGQPMVRNYEAERSQNVVLALDCGRLMAERFDHLERLDHALAGAVVLSRVAESWADNVGVLAFADSVSKLLTPGAFRSSRLMEELSDLEARPVEPDYPKALLLLSRELRRRSLIVVFTDVVDDEVSEPLAAHLSLLARRHLPLLVALRNPSLFEAESAPPDDLDATYRRAAAAELIGARRTSLERLRRAGVQVVDIDPSDSVTAAVDAYLEIKLRGRL